MSSHASMNRIYRLVFNAATGMYVAVAETAKGRGKAGRSASAAMLAALTAIGGVGGLSTAGAQNVLPTGGVVASGSASISQTSSAMTVNQTTSSAILNWQSFSIGAANSVRFNQPSASSIALNRVIGNSASEILGSLSANGKVMLVNQNGILMGAGAQVDTGGFLASTLNIKDSDFLAGRYIFDIANNTGGTAGNIINNGRINTPSGYAVLIAPQVTNNGFIAARAGTVAIGAGNKVSLDMVGDGLISLKVDQAALNAAIVNTGTLQANGGTVLLKASSANALFDTVINSTGIIRADSIANVNGRIILDGGSTGITEVTGEITARGLNAGETGGSISVLGDKVGLLGSGKLDASGDAGGGTVLLGGNWQGSGIERTASRIIVASNASIDVSATNNGNGGTAVVWSDGRTDMGGSVKATGGANGGNGGNVETSGKVALDLKGRVDIAAPNGTGGQWLLDPNDINITTATTNASVFGPTYQDDASANNATVDAAALGIALTGGATVNVQTSNAGTSGGTGAITVTNAITATGAGTLNLIANGGITVNASISNAAGNALNVGLYAGSNSTVATIATAGSQAGAITTSGSGNISTGGGKVTMVSGSASSLTTGGLIATTGGDVTLNAGGAMAVNGGINVDTGTVRLQSTGALTQGSGVITAANLGVRASNVTLNAARNSITNTAAIRSEGNIFKFTNRSSYAIDTVAADGTLFTAVNGFSAGGSAALMELRNTAGTVSQAAGKTITTHSLWLSGDAAFTLTDTGNAVVILAASTGSGAIKYVNGTALTVGRLTNDNDNVVEGITRAANVSVNTQTGTLTLQQNINAGTAQVRLQAVAGTVNQTGGVITAGALGVKAGGGDVLMGDRSNAASVVALAATGDVQYKSANGYTIGSVSADAPAFSSDLYGIKTNGTGKNITLDTAAGTVAQQSDELNIGTTATGGLELKGNAAYTLTDQFNGVGKLAASTGTGNINYYNRISLEIGTVNTAGISRTGNVTLQTGRSGVITQTAAVAAANLELLGGQAATLTNAGNNIANLSGNTGALSVTNTGALTLGALTTAGALTLNTGGTVSQTGALTQTGGAVNVTATAGTVKLTNTANDVSGTVNLSATAGGVAFVNNNAAGIQVGDITAATSMNSTNAANISNFTASDAALTGVALLQARRGNIERIGATKIVADRAVLVAANRIGGATAADSTLGVRVEGAAGASAREVYLSAGATQTASVFGPTAVPTFYKSLMNGATALPSPLSTTYNGVVAAFGPIAAMSTASSSNTNESARRAQNIAQNQATRLSQPEVRLNPVVRPRVEQANNQLGNDLRNVTRAEPITIPSCAPGAAREAAAGQC